MSSTRKTLTTTINIYDPEEWFFPGAEEVDGTVTGAMKAGNPAKSNSGASAGKVWILFR